MFSICRHGQAIKDAAAADNNYVAAVKRAREARVSYDVGMASVMEQLQQLESSRISGVVEYLKRYIKVRMG